MSNSKSYSTIFGMAHAVDFIRFLNDKGEVYASEVRAVMKNYSSIVQLARALEEAGIITIVVTTSPRITHTYTLTKKGKLIANKFDEIDLIVQSYDADV